MSRIQLTFIFFLTFSSTFVYAQLLESLTKEPTSIDQLIDRTSNRDSLAEHLIGTSLFKNLHLDSNPSKDFYPVDFDSDGRTDIIFYGYTGGESTYLYFLRNEIDHFEKVADFAGKLMFISKPSEYEPISFVINQYGCCASINDVIEFYTVNNLGQEPKIVLTRKIAMIAGTDIPTRINFMNPVFFETINDEYTLRSEPKINNDTGHHPDYDMTGNILAVYPSKSRGTAIARQIDSTGRIWYLVVMENNLEPIKHMFFEGYNNKEKYESLGWMSSRYITEY